MKAFISTIFGTRNKLSRLERGILDAVKNCLPTEFEPLWERQVAAINRVQRLPGGVEVNFFRVERGKPTFDDEIAFPNRTDELLIARLEIAAVRASPILKAQVWSVNGFLFSIEYDRDPAYFEEAFGMDPAPQISFACELVGDLTGCAW